MSELALETSYAESRFKTTLSSIKLLLTASIACPDAIAFSEPNNNILGAFDALINCDALDAFADVNGAAYAESKGKPARLLLHYRSLEDAITKFSSMR